MIFSRLIINTKEKQMMCFTKRRAEKQQMNGIVLTKIPGVSAGDWL